MRVLLISTYELGRQPFGLASPAAWLRAAGFEVACADLSRTAFAPDQVTAADLVAFYLPMHTATRLSVPILARVRALNPAVHICSYGLYAPLNAEFLREHGVDTVLGGEFEQALVDLARRVQRRQSTTTEDTAPPAIGHGGRPTVPRLTFLTPDRSGLPSLSRYAALEMGHGERRTVGNTEASRGCKHLCRHCPVVPVYQGQFRIVPVDIVLADIRAQVAAGAQHITFGDPDFFNGVTHAMRIVEDLAREFSGLTYDATIKVEHLRQHRRRLSRLVETGCLFVTTAVESVDDDVLARLEKGHTRADFVEVLRHAREIGLTLSPTFVAFTPWTSLEGYCDLLQTIDELDLVEQVAPVQLAIRLLLPRGSRLLELSDVRSLIGDFQLETLSFSWAHPDSQVDDLQIALAKLVASRSTMDRRSLFDEIFQLAHERAGLPPVHRPVVLIDRAAVPYLNEPWYC